MTYMTWNTSIFWGHSLGLADLPYFKAITDAISHPEKLTWKVSYHTNKDKEALKKIFLQHITPPLIRYS